MPRKKRRKLDFESVLLQTIPVRLGDKAYTLREASTEMFARYRSAIFARSTLKQGKDKDSPTFKFEGLAEMDIYLLSLCLTEDETGNNVLETEIREWPSRITEPLIAELKEMSGIETGSTDEEYEEQVKNLQEGLTVGSV
jgi:hypothetical protein